jgi:uncharacterized protein (TIGR03663 family)
MKRSVVSLVVLILVVAGAAAIRLVRLENRPMHTDEAVHAFKFGDLLEADTYVYDPHEYHGPTLNYMTIPVVRLDGGNSLAQTTEAQLRLVPAICGILVIAGLWLIRDGIGRAAMICAAVLCAASPAMIFYSRYYIQEMLLVCFTFFALAAFWRCAADRNIVLRVFWMIVAGACLGLMHATKETCIIPMFAMGAAGFCAMLFSLLKRDGPALDPSGPTPGPPPLPGQQPLQEAIDDTLRKTAAAPSFKSKIRFCAIAGAVVLVAGAAVSVTLFSSFFTHSSGPWDSIATYGNYLFRSSGEGSAGNHSHPWHYYLELVGFWPAGDGTVWTEGFVLILAAVGLIAGLIGRGCGKASVTFVRFLGVYTIAMTVVYSALSYKTPWCLLGFYHGMLLLAGVGAAVLLRLMKPVGLKAIVAVILLVGTSHLAWQGYSASFTQCADPGNPYVYAHPTWDVMTIVEKVRGIAEVHPDKKDMHVQVLCEDNHPWPFPWYFRDFTRFDVRVTTDKQGCVLPPPGPLAPVYIYSHEPSKAFEDALTLKMLMSAQYDDVTPETPEGQEPREWELRPFVELEMRVDRKLLKKYNASRPVKPQ